MRKKPFILVIVYIFFAFSGSVFGLGEKIIEIGADSSWNLMEKRQGIIEAPRIRPHSVLVLSAGMGKSASGAFSLSDEAYGDLYLSFDEAQAKNFADSSGRYQVSVSEKLQVAAVPWSRVGAGAALFNDDEPIVLRPGKSALFASGNHIRDFSIEFWLYPHNLDNGEQILSWTASKPDGRGAYLNQRIHCAIQKNRLQWTFGDFFFSPGERERKNLVLSGPVILNRSWSHHLIRFDADLGLLEYLVDGNVEAVEYATASGREGGEVYTPVIGEDGRLLLGGHLTGLMDEFRIYGLCLEKVQLAKYPSEGGRVESRTLDLGHSDSQILRLEAFGGRTGTSRVSGRVQNNYAGNSALRFSDHSELRFSIRASNSPYRWNDISWIPVNPGAALPDTLRGRYIQIAVDFYPGESGETSPYLSELRLVYNAAEPPPPPTQVFAVAKNGAVELSWNASTSRDTGGYLIYYGTARGEYFGDSAMPGRTVQGPASPVDAGNRTSVRIEGLNNGTLYFFAIAAYNKSENPYPGERIALSEPGNFSREAAARPLRMAE